MLERLRENPGDLFKLFENILGDGKDRKPSDVCFKIILFSLRPLSPEELYFAVHFHEHEWWTGYWVHNKITPETITAFVKYSSKGLAEVVNPSHWNEPHI